jgi:hypothetical protein
MSIKRQIAVVLLSTTIPSVLWYLLSNEITSIPIFFIVITVLNLFISLHGKLFFVRDHYSFNGNNSFRVLLIDFLSIIAIASASSIIVLHYFALELLYELETSYVVLISGLVLLPLVASALLYLCTFILSLVDLKESIKKKMKMA